MSHKSRRPIYVIDEASADRLMNLSLKYIAALRQILDHRRVELPDEFDFGSDELGFFEAQAKAIAESKRGIDADEIF